MKSIPRSRATILAALCGILALVAVAAIRSRTIVGNRPASSSAPTQTRDADHRGDVAAPTAAAEVPIPLLFVQRVSHQGIAVEFSVQHVNPSKRSRQEVREGDDVRIRFRITDTAGTTPVRKLNPAAWMDLVRANEIRAARSCEQKVKAFLGGSIFGKAELDLNVYNVLTLNNEPNISVVDPLFGFGGTKLLSMVVLESPGEDWVINANETRVYVSLPDVRKIATVDTAGWEVVATTELPRRPGRIALQPDERRLWVAEDPADADEPSGIMAVETGPAGPATRIITGRGRHEIAFSHDGRRAFITNERDGTLSVIETRTLKTVGDLPVGQDPGSVAFSPLARMAYVASRGDGTITAVDGERPGVIARIKAEPGLGQIRFAPGGRLGFVVNPVANVVHILDTASNRIVQTADVNRGPDQVVFSEEMAYIRHRDSPEVLMVPLKAVGVEKQRVQVFSFPGGQFPPGKANRLSPADAIVQAPGESAVLVANPADKAVYFYKEGMAAPMGNFSNYGRQPRAVLVVDRSLREHGSPGIYETIARMRRPGDYDMVFLLDSPRIVHCFSLTVRPDPLLEAKRLTGKLLVEHLVEQKRMKVGETARLRFRLTDRQTRATVPGLTDVEVLTNLMPGIWHKRHVASHQGDGIYQLDFAPPRPGLYYIYVQCLSRGLAFNNDQFLVLEVVKNDEDIPKN